MLKILRLSDDEYIVKVNNRAIYGNKIRTCVVLQELGINWDEIERGLVSLQLHNHQIADYGVKGTFIYSARLDA
jgi:hypothetical protein